MNVRGTVDDGRRRRWRDASGSAQLSVVNVGRRIVLLRIRSESGLIKLKHIVYFPMLSLGSQSRE